jgi:hypothetical protein
MNRLGILAMFLLLALLVSPATAHALDVYVLSGGDATTDQALVNALTARGHAPTLGVQSIVFDGTQATLTDFDVVVLQNNHNWAGSSMPVAGQDAIVSFVSGGGGLVTTEWLIWNINSAGKHQNLSPIVPVTGGPFNHATNTTYTQQTADPVVGNGMPGSFTFSVNNISGSESFLAAKVGATVFYSSTNDNASTPSSWHGVVGGPHGLGRVISFSTFVSSVEMANADYARLFVNSVEWAGKLGAARIGHFLCYKAKLTKGAPKFQAFGIGLSDQFESGDFDVTKPVSLCNPADKRGEGIVDPDTHLAGYEIKLTATTPKQPAHVKQTNLKITNQFHSGANPLSVDTVKPDRLLVPTAKSLSAQPPAPDPATHDVDHYKCYKVKVTPKTPKFVPILAVTVEDQFTTPAKRYDIKKPTRLCTPADKEHPAGTDTVARHPAVHLMCYQAALTKEKPAQSKHVPVVGIFVENQFDPERLDSVKEEELCVPSAKTVSGSPAATATTAAADDDEDVVTDDEDDD